MLFARPVRCAVSALALFFSISIPAAAQFRGQVFVSGLDRPLAFVQDPSNAGVQYVVEQGGLIRTIQNGTLLGSPFLDLRGSVLTGGERGLLGLAFAPNYAETGRFWVTFVNTDGNVVVARFRRA